MNTFWKITLGFMIGVVCTLATLIVFGTGYNQYVDEFTLIFKDGELEYVHQYREYSQEGKIFFLNHKRQQVNVTSNAAFRTLLFVL